MMAKSQAPLKLVQPDDKQPTAARLRALISDRDRLARRLSAIDSSIAKEARNFADEQGEFVRPNLDALRRRLFERTGA